MQRLDDSNRRLENSSSASGQLSLDDIGGEPLAGSEFENEEPESEFASAGEES